MPVSQQPIGRSPSTLSQIKFLVAETNLVDLLQLRNLVMFILTFSGFLRSSEFCVIRSRDVQFNGDYLTISIEKRKTYQLKEGRSVVIAEPSSTRVRVRYLSCICMKP